MSGILSQSRSRSARRANHFSKRFPVNPGRKERTSKVSDRLRARLRRLSRQAGWKAATCATLSQDRCDLRSHFCVAICRRKSMSCPAMRHECVAGADLTAIDLTEVRDDG